MSTEKSVAKDIINAVGSENIQSISHCATRIRIVPKKAKKIKSLDEGDIIKGSLLANKGFQVFVRLAEIEEVYQEIEDIVNQ